MRAVRMKKRTNIFLKLAMIVFIVFALVSIIRMQFRLNALKDQEAALRAEQQEHNYKVEELQEKVDAEFDAEYIERVAREKLGLRMPGEIVYHNDLSQ